jgi:hypothetical protein
MAGIWRNLSKKKNRYPLFLLDSVGMVLVVYHGGEDRGINTPSLGLSGLDTLEKKVLIGWAHMFTEYYEARAFCWG